MAKKYRVGLTEEEQEELKAMVSKGRAAAYKQTHARILLLCDENQADSPMMDQEIAWALKVGTATVERVRRRCVEEGVEAALGRKQQLNRRRKKLDGQGEAHLVAMACSQPPEGRVSWTLRMLADGLMEREIVESISTETVRRTLKKNQLKPWLKECWCLPPQGSAEFVCAMEDVLEVYHRSYGENEVLVCLDETSKQLVQETRQPRPAQPGAVGSYDYEYERNGVSNLFMLFVPLEGWRRVEATERRTKVDWARVVRKLVDEGLRRPRADSAGDGQLEHPSSRIFVRGIRAGGGPAHCWAAGDTLHAEARELAQYSRDRVGGAGAAVSGPPDCQSGNPRAGNKRMAGETESGRGPGGLAFHSRGRTGQAQVPLPINTTVID